MDARRQARTVLCLVILALVPRAAQGQSALGPLRPSRENPRYFADPSGRVIYLAGAHDGWELQDYAWGDRNQGVEFDWPGFLDSLVEHNHNVFRLWCVEHTKINDNDPDLTTPMPYRRVSGRGKANDGGDKFDLDELNPAYFERMRKRVIEAGDRGVYAIVMLFQGWSIEDKRGRVNPWPYHPFHRNNNVNGIDGDLDGDGQGKELHTWLGQQHPITRHQLAYVRKVIDTVGDLDNVLYEIANESHHGSIPWQIRITESIHQVEARLAKQHPVGITATFGYPRRQGINELLLRSPADWISPNREARGGYDYRANPPPVEGTKVILSDTDHLFGVGCKDHAWVWKTFCRGHNLLYMDMWTQQRDDSDRTRVRASLGHTRQYARRMNLVAMTPRGDLASTGYALAEPGREYLVYAPSGGPITVDLSPAVTTLAAEWLNPRTGAVVKGPAIDGGDRRTLQPPFDGDAVLYLHAVED